MAYEAKNYGHLLGMGGLSDSLLMNHFTLYQGYVKNTNLLLDRIQDCLKQKKESTPEYAEFKRRFGWEFNGMRLHELYFSNMKKGGSPLSEGSDLKKKITDDFESRENWEKDFRAVSTMRGIGWVVLCHDPIGGRLFNVWVTEHDAGHLATASVLLVLDVFEHAYTLDYGLKKADYVEAFFKAIDWEEVSARFKKK
jgi:superoxide dismutase, Fe-Mn family